MRQSEFMCGNVDIVDLIIAVTVEKSGEYRV